jgi:mannose-1-phosphate guanylyltransferase
MSESFALIMAGGGGTRLWPSSRRQRPKQLLTLGGDETLIAGTFRRAVALCGRERTLVVTAADQANSVRTALPDLPRDNLVVEPAPRNTSAAVGLGAAVVARRAGPHARFAMLPSDAFIADEAAFLDSARLALAHAGEAIVTISIKPTSPETGYGYLRPGAAPAGAAGAAGLFEVAGFVEKPSAEMARQLCAQGCSWNAGIFFMTTGRMLAEARRHLPKLGAILEDLVRSSTFEATLAARYPAAPAISLDFGIMEKTSGILTVVGSFGWNDVGSWAAMPIIRPADTEGNVTVGDTLALRARGNIIVSDEGAPLIAASGVDDLVIVATRDAVLVTRRQDAQSVREVVDALTRKGRTDLV